MRLHLLREHVEDAGLAGLVQPTGSDAATEPFGAVLAGNLLSDDPPAIPARLPARTLIAWSGTLAQTSLFDRDPRTWLPQGLERFRRVLDDLAPRLEATGSRLLFRPHARHVLCDPQRCLTLLGQWRDTGAPFGLILEPAAMLEHDMLDAADDHLARAFEALAAHASALLLENVARPDPTPGEDADEDPPPLDLRPLHRGQLDPERLLDLTRAHWPGDRPLILRDDEADAQIALLRGEREAGA